ncbi:conserved hypothetical protein [Candidatus Nitrotoga sp. BS]|uniref:cupin domain-containing protein n=1 Tax=Candidatus Nitrotoga sp. BS TaxID=2890408 RepID=UPI001EF3589E|nr:cupin domain-containing protein [Candidatus Nitrotoga sp. BS]CAH1196972.1 conserved hypothetical protein [Candidatus Nitrotoga sp. BS]
MTFKSPTTADAIQPDSDFGDPEPFHLHMGMASWRALGDYFGLIQFGVSQDTLQPGAQSSLRHWHTLSDEFVYMLEGELVLRINDGEFMLKPGMFIGFKAGDNNAHHLVNRGLTAASFLVIGSRVPDDVPIYPDDDLAMFNTETGRIEMRKDGSPIK